MRKSEEAKINMINIIKTAVATIIISIISGLLLDRFKNLAPRILCNIGNGVPMQINNKKVYAYSVAISNLSKKIVHELTLNIQSSQSNLNIADAKITKGLKFDYSIKDGILNIDIPFLNKDDKFSVTVYVEDQNGVHNNKPVAIIRSPENFKQVDSVEQKGVLSLLSNIPKDINEAISKITRKTETMDKENGEIPHKNKKLSKNKKAMIITVSIILVMIAGVLGKSYFKGTSTNTQTPSVKTNDHKQSTDTKGSANGTTKNTDVKSSTGRTTKNADTNTSTGGATKNTDTNASTDRTNKNTDTNNTSTDRTTKNKDTNTSTSGTNKNKDTNTTTPADGTKKNTDTTTPADGTTKNTDANTSTDGTTKNADTNTSTGGTTSNTGN